MFQFGFAKENITPERGLPLCGYFNPRPNRGTYDELNVKAAVFQTPSGTAAVCSFDLCMMDDALLGKLTAAARREKLPFADDVIYSVTHTHTGPYTGLLFGTGADEGYLAMVVEKTMAALKRAWKNLAPAEMLHGSAKSEGLSFNRRYRMKDGGVLTNPGKLNPDIVEPEGPVEESIELLAVRQDGMFRLIMANISNHSDTVDGDVVSADWPGRFEAAVQAGLTYDVPVMTIIFPQGNINHFDVKSAASQSSYGEAVRIGRKYASFVLPALEKLEKIEFDTIRTDHQTIRIPYAVISDEEAKAAEKLLAETKDAASGGSLTSEGLAKGDVTIARFFAGELLEFKKSCSGKARDFDLVSIKFGDQVVIQSLPGEPFVQIGQYIRKNSPFKVTFVSALSQGECGYIPFPECFAAGGYEIRPVVGGAPAHDTALRLQEEASKLVNR